MKKYLLMIICINFASAFSKSNFVPTIAFPEPAISFNYNSQELTQGSESNTYYDIDAILKLRNNLPKFSLQITNELQNSGKFKVLNTESSIISDFRIDPNSENVIKHLALENELNTKNSIIPDYILFTSITNISATKTVNPITATDKNSLIYRLDITIDCRLVRTKDRQIIAVFTAAGHSGQAFITNASDKFSPLTASDILTLMEQNRIELSNEIVSNLIYNYNQELLWSNKNNA